MSGRARNWWVMYVALLPVFTVSLTRLVRRRTDFAQVWPIWRPMILDLLLVVAAACLVAAAAFGVHAWRQARRDAHA